MKHIPARAALSAALLSLAFPAAAQSLDVPPIDRLSDLACADDASLLKWALGALAFPVGASLLANLRSRLPPAAIKAIDIVALNFVKATTKTAPVLAAVAILVLAACSSAQTAAVAGFESTAFKGVQSAEDNNILLWRTDACGTPFSAVVRNAQTVPGLVPALSALCVPNADKGNPNDLLKSVP